MCSSDLKGPHPTGIAAPTPSQRATTLRPVSSSRAARTTTPAAPPASVTSPGSVSPGPAGTASSPPAVQLTASVNVNAQQGQWQGAQIAFQVNDTGSAATQELTVSITLPAGTWLLGDQGGQGSGQGQGGDRKSVV